MPDKLFEDWAKATFGNITTDGTPRWKSLPYLTELKQAWKNGFQMGKSVAQDELTDEQE
jgi:hypothetical protein